jgi:hypothetical protein
VMRREWHCPRCVERNSQNDRWCYFCRWDAEAADSMPDEWRDKADKPPAHTWREPAAS